MEKTPQGQDNKPQTNGMETGFDTSLVFGHDSHFAFVYKKTEKLVTAVYMITNLIKDNEPLKWKVREEALSLMEVNLDLHSASISEHKDLLKEYRTIALEIVSLFSVAHHSGLISEMNFRVLVREFNSLVSALENDESKNNSRDTIVLDPGFFAVEQPEQKDQPLNETNVLNGSKGQTSKTAVAPTKMSLTDNSVSKTQDVKDSRKSIIIKLLSKKSGLNVKDFSDNIKGVSEKTIQRELMALVAAGVLKKEGDRRWSTYSLAVNS